MIIVKSYYKNYAEKKPKKVVTVDNRQIAFDAAVDNRWRSPTFSEIPSGGKLIALVEFWAPWV